jgi:hypothetical protein
VRFNSRERATRIADALNKAYADENRLYAPTYAE